MVLSLVVIAAAAPILAPHDPTRAVAPTYGEPGSAQPRLSVRHRRYWAATCCRGSSIGARVSLIVGVAGMLVTMTIGVAIGLAAGFFRGAIDLVLMRFTDVMLTLPALLLAMALVAVLSPSLVSILIVIGLVSWTHGRARAAGRSAVGKPARLHGGGALAGRLPIRLIARHLLPNVLPLIVVMAALSTSGTLLLDAGLSFLGLGVPPPTPSWGRMIQEAELYFRVAPWLAAFPGLAIFYAVLGFNLFGYGYLRRQRR